MGEDSGWRIVFYRTADGKSPVREFLTALDEKTRTRFAWSIEQLQIRNVQARPPLVKHLGAKGRKSDKYLSTAILFLHRSADSIFAWISKENSKDTSAGN